MNRQRITLLVEVDLDPVPGWGHIPSDMEYVLRRHLDDTIPHYNPKVGVLDLERALRLYAAMMVWGRADGLVRETGSLLDPPPPEPAQCGCPSADDFLKHLDGECPNLAPAKTERQCRTKTPEPHLAGEFPMSCYDCHMVADA